MSTGTPGIVQLSGPVRALFQELNITQEIVLHSVFMLSALVRTSFNQMGNGGYYCFKSGATLSG